MLQNRAMYHFFNIKKPEIVSVINSFAFLQSWEAEAT